MTERVSELMMEASESTDPTGVRHGQIAGWVVLTWNLGMGWKDDWDGEVHKTLGAGRKALKEASESGETCILTKCVRVAGS